MTQADIAKKHRVSQALISYIKSGSRTTLSVGLARDLARLTGEPAIIYIKESVRHEYLRAHRNLGKGAA